MPQFKQSWLRWFCAETRYTSVFSANWPLLSLCYFPLSLGAISWLSVSKEALAFWNHSINASPQLPEQEGLWNRFQQKREFSHSFTTLPKIANLCEGITAALVKREGGFQNCISMFSSWDLLFICLITEHIWTSELVEVFFNESEPMLFIIMNNFPFSIFHFH